MVLSLDKGSKLSLDKFQASDLKVLRVEMTWDAPEKTSSFFKSYDYDLDVIAAIVDKDNKAVDGSKHFCFFNQQETPAIKSSGDDLNGDDGGESLLITLDKVPEKGKHIPIIVDLHKARERKQNLSQMKDGTVRILNHETDELLAEIKMNTFSSSDTSILFVVVNRTDTGFEVENVSTAYPKSIADWIELYQVQ